MKIKVNFLKLFFLTLILANGFVATKLFSMKRGRDGFGKRKRCHRMVTRSQVPRTRSGQKRAPEGTFPVFKKPKRFYDWMRRNPIENHGVQNVPSEIWMKILGYLEPISWNPFRRTCKYFGQIWQAAKIEDLVIIFTALE